MILFARMLTASALASAAFAATSETTQSSTFVLTGEILVYAPHDTGLPMSTLVAPRGARVDRPQVLNVEGISTAAADGSHLESSTLVHGRSPLVMGEQGGRALEVGDLTLRHDADGWTLFAAGDELKGRPVFRLVSDDHNQKATRDGGFTLTGELVLHEAMAAELGMQSASIPAPLVVGSVTLLASRAQGGITSTLTVPAAPISPVPLPPAPVAGPDVIVSTIGSGLAKDGTVGSITAFSVTTVSCNIGTQEAEWFASTNHHPVIGTQMYRLKTVSGSTRFEQIGMSWLKHGFCAADASNCGQAPTPNGSCDWLGLWSTDTYGTGLNGSQPNLGPRSEVQAWTGVYPYPYVLAGGQSGNAIYKRCQVENADLDPGQNSGASYVGEVVYICTDEPDGNKYNNYSNRSFTVSGTAGSGNYSASFGSTTTNREQSAIQRWPLLDTGVTLVNVDVPGDGRFVVGAKVTALGGGNYHYEYAVFNMNSHQSARLVRVPADGTVTVSNIGFHDVPYHSGEPYSGTDWTSSRNATDMEWSTSTFAANANANALRWSTTYNFRFDADAPPVTGNLTIGLFRNGGNVTAAGLPVPGSGLPQNIAYCFGDGLGTFCPCGNSSSPPATGGCSNSLLLGGVIGVAGTPSISADSLVLMGSDMPNGPALYFQGTAQNGSGTGFGDGLLCVGGSIIRLGVEFNVAGASQHPSGDPAITVHGLVGAPGVRTYQAWYRDSEPTFCTPPTFNLTNGRQVVWVP